MQVRITTLGDHGRPGAEGKIKRGTATVPGHKAGAIADETAEVGFGERTSASATGQFQQAHAAAERVTS